MEISCDYLGQDVELSEERISHITGRHPDVLPDNLARIEGTLADPDVVRYSIRSNNARLISRWFPDLRNGKHVVVVVATDTFPRVRHWVVTAYLTSRVPTGEIEWQRD